MKRPAGIVASLFFLLLLPVSCKKDNGFNAGGPITMYLLGKWRLERVISPSGTKQGSQIGYSEVLEIGNEREGDFDRVFRNDTLLFTADRVRSPAPEASSKKMTMTIYYFSHGKRFFKLSGSGENRTMEASTYLPVDNSKPDTVRYFYHVIR